MCARPHFEGCWEPLDSRHQATALRNSRGGTAASEKATSGPEPGRITPGSMAAIATPSGLAPSDSAMGTEKGVGPGVRLGVAADRAEETVGHRVGGAGVDDATAVAGQCPSARIRNRSRRP